MSDDDLFARLADRSALLTDDDVAAARALFARDPAAAERLVGHWRLDDELSRCLDPGRHDFANRLHTAIRNSGSSARFVQRVRWAARRQQRRFPSIRLVAIAAGLLLAFTLTWRIATAPAPAVPAPAVATVLAAHGWIERAGTRVPLAERRVRDLLAGDRLVSDGAEVTIRYADGTVIDLVDGALLTVLPAGGDGAKRLLLERGALRATVAPQPVGAPLRIATPQAEATVVGTRLRLAIADGITRLEVEHGKVALSRPGGGSLLVQAGEAAEAAAGSGPWRVVPPEVARGPRAASGLPTDPAVFPIGVWEQDPADAAAYQRAGINLFVGLRQGSGAAELATLATAGMRAFCDPDTVDVRSHDNAAIAGWLIANAPELVPSTGGPGPAGTPGLEPREIARRCAALRQRDPVRPILLLLGGAAVAQDPAALVQGADLLASACFPVNATDPLLAGDLARVALGVDRLRAASGGAKPVWAWIECARLTANAPAGPTPDQVRAQVWMALIHGAKGIVYAGHSQAAGSLDRRALLRDAEMLAAVAVINRDLAALAPALAGPALTGAVVVTASDPGVPIDVLALRHAGTRYVFAAAMRAGATTATFRVPVAAGTVRVLGEERALTIVDGVFADRFAPFAVHLYAITE